MKIYYSLLLLSLFVSCQTIYDVTPECSNGSCKSIVVSKAIPSDDPVVLNGVVYSIPKELLELHVSRKAVTREQLQAALVKAEEAKTTADNAVKEKETQIKALEQNLGAAQSEEAKAKLALELELEKLNLLLLKQDQITKNTTLSQARTTLNNFVQNPSANQFQDVFQLKKLAPVPSPNLTFVALTNNSPISSETYEIKTTTTGLLSGGSAKSEGQLDEIFVNLVQAISTLRTSPGDIELAIEGVESGENECNAPHGTTLKIQFDPSNPNHDTDVTNQLIEAKLCYQFELTSESSPMRRKISSNRTSLQKETINPGILYDGLLYPRTISIQYNLLRRVIQNGSNSDGGYKLVRSFYPTVVDTRILGAIPLRNGLFADNDYEYEFKNGMLTRYKSVTPNQLVSALSAIPAAGRALLSIPAEIIQLKVDFSSKESAYYEAQKAVLESRLAIEQALLVQETAMQDSAILID